MAESSVPFTQDTKLGQGVFKITERGVWLFSEQLWLTAALIFEMYVLTSSQQLCANLENNLQFIFEGKMMPV